MRVDAVENAREHPAALLQHAFQPATQRAALDFLRVTRADRVDRVGKHHSRLQQVQAAMKLHLVPVEVFPVQARQQHVPMPELALVRDVVNRQQAGHPPVTRHGVVLDLQIGRNQSRLPIVDVQHVDLQVEQPHGLEHGPAEKDEPLAVVDVILAVDAVQLVAIVVLVLLDQIHRHAAAGQRAAEQVARDHLAADGNDEIDPQPLDGQAAIAGLAVGGQDDGRLMPQPLHFDRQCAADIGQSARLGKGNRLTRGQQDIHSVHPVILRWEPVAEMTVDLAAQPRHPAAIIADLRVVQKAESTQSLIFTPKSLHQYIQQVPYITHLVKDNSAQIPWLTVPIPSELRPSRLSFSQVRWERGEE